MQERNDTNARDISSSNDHKNNADLTALAMAQFPLYELGILKLENEQIKIDEEKLAVLKTNLKLNGYATKDYQATLEKNLITTFNLDVDKKRLISSLAFAQKLQQFIEFITVDKANIYQRAKEFGLLSTRFQRFIEENDVKTSNKNILTNNLLKYPDYASSILLPEDNQKAEVKLGNAIIKELHDSDIKDVTKFMSIITENKQSAETFRNKVANLSYINLDGYAGSKDTWSKVARMLVGLAPEITSKQDSTAFINGLLHDDSNPVITPLQLVEKTKTEGWNFWRALGRTLLLKNAEGDVLAVKVQKFSEPADELTKEYKTTKYIRENAEKIGLEGKMPAPQSVNEISRENLMSYLENIPAESLTRFHKMIGKKDNYTTYIYKVGHDHQDYFTYLHDISLTDEEFAKGSRIGISNLYKLLAQQLVFPQLADLFHNSGDYRSDRGRYQILANLFDSSDGSGKLKAWKVAVAYPNVRGPKSGLADWGDYAVLSDLMFGGDFTRKYFAYNQREHGAKIGNYIVANLIAEYQYVFFLIAGYRGSDLTKKALAEGKSTDEIKAIWTTLANQIVDNSALAISVLTHQSEQSAKQSLLSIVDVDRLARQMQFWMTKEYIPHVKNLNIPADIYGPKTRVELTDVSGINDEVGFTEDNVQPDLGQTSGQEPIKEANKLFYWMNNIIFSAYHQFQLTLNDVKKCEQVHDPKQAESVKQTLFSHLPTKQYHAAHVELLKDALKNKSLTADDSEKLKKDLKEHQQHYAASTIQNFWRNRKFSAKHAHRLENTEQKLQEEKKEASSIKIGRS